MTLNCGWWAVGVMLLVAGCAALEPPVPGGGDTYTALRRYYQANALERDGRCRRPYLDGILGSEVVEQTPERTVLRVTYAYRDLLGDETEGRRRFPNGTDRCRGIEERTFALASGPGGAPRVVEMSGLERGDPLPALFH